MISNNIILIIFLIIIVGIIVYFYYNYKNTGVIHPNSNMTVSIQKNPNRSSKKVRFNDKIKYRTYKNPQYSSSHDSQINVDDIVSSIQKSDSLPEDEHMEQNDIQPSNHDDTDPEAAWDANFGTKLISEQEKNKFFDKIHQNHRDYQKSLGQFAQYQTDDSTLIKTDITIDPFKPERRSNTLKGKTIKEIYDEQVAGPKAIPKKIKNVSSSSVVYENENVMNGGRIKGTNLHGYDCTQDGYKTAAFGDEF